MKALRLISLLLALAMLTVLALSGCGSNSSADGGTTAATDTKSADPAVPGETADPFIADREAISDDLPAKDYGGKTFTVFAREELKHEFVADAEASEVVSEAIYNRNRTVEDRFNVKIETVAIPGNWDVQNVYLTQLRNTVKAGDDLYNLIAGYAAYITVIATEGLVADLNTVPNLNFEKPWWSQDIVKELNIADKQYFVTGDLALTVWEYMFAMYFNKQMVADYGIENPYDLVRSGKWTFDKLIEICKDVYTDVNGDNKKDPDDLFGYATETGNLVDIFHIAFDQPVTQKGADGFPEYCLNTPKMADIVDRLYTFLWEAPGVIAQPESVTYPSNPYKTLFKNDRAMIIPEYLGNAKELRDMPSDFGIIPYPKYNETQKDYQTIAQDGYSLFSIPVTVQDMEFTGTITEALCAESYKKVIPAFYNVALKSKYSRDNDSVEMLDIIRRGLKFNFGILYTVETGRAFHILRVMMSQKQKNFVSQYEKNENVINKGLQKVIEDYKKITG